MNHTDIMQSFDNTGLLRNVVEADIFLSDGTKIAEKKALLFEDDRSYISTVGRKYKVIQNEEVLSNVATSLLESGLNLDGMEIGGSSSATKARSLVNIQLPEYKIEVRPGDYTIMELLARNSFDGSWKFQLDIGGFRMACANGQIIGESQKQYSNRHTSGYTPEMLIQHLLNGLDVFTNMGEQWATMKGIKITRDQAFDMILDYLRKEWKNKEKRQEILDSKRSKSVQELVQLWGKYHGQMGSNMFSLYNTLTDYASHVGNAKSPADIKDVRQRQVVKTIDTWVPQLLAA